MELWEAVSAWQAEAATWTWRGTFADYFRAVVQHPTWARLAHARIYDMVAARGVDVDPDGRSRYPFFAEHLFGLDEAVSAVMEYFRAAALRLEVRKRILLLVGPVGGGKSTLVQLLKRGLEEYSRSEAGALFAIAGCPMHEEPLHLIPEALRPTVRARYGLYIEGELCPRCRQRVAEEFGGDIAAVPVERICLSESERVGIGTFSPSDPKSQDIAELTGSVDLQAIGEWGAESDPRAFRFDGELNVANRGLMEFIEVLKCDERFLYTLLTLAQEQRIKTGRYALIYADEAVVAHTNEAEFRRFLENRRNEALVDRLVVVRVPYTLKVSEEERIYAKLLGEADLGGLHLAPHTLRVAAMFAVLSRLRPSRRYGLSLVAKMHRYDGQADLQDGAVDLEALRAEWPDEGMDGLSPRFVFNRLATAAVRAHGRCLGPIEVMRALREGVQQWAGADAAERERLFNLLYEVRREYEELARHDVQRALVDAYETAGQALADRYWAQVQAYLGHGGARDPITGQPVAADEALMRAIEEPIGITEAAKRAFREEIAFWVAAGPLRGQALPWRDHPGLREAIERQLFADLRRALRLAGHGREGSQGVVSRLVAEGGYCPVCAEGVLHYLSTAEGG
ncbi:MAG: protein prkA [Firmicutes bacterium]|nr:protein prkA [Alicyclobacillaceae bacterium]MCL6496838.1 protein prkA [Bacillota bacterium]